MKILHVIDKLGVGGAQVLLKDILEYPILSNTEHCLFVLRSSENAISIDSKLVQELGEIGRYSLLPAYKFMQTIQSGRYEVIHLHLKKSIMFGLFICILFPNQKFVIHEHGAVFRVSKFSIYAFVLRVLSRYADKIIGVSLATKEELIKKCGVTENKIVVLPNPISESKLGSWQDWKKRKIGNINSTVETIGYIGRLHKIKGVIYLLEAMVSVHNRFPDVKLIIVGDGEDREYLESFVHNHSLDSCVQFVGFKPDVKIYLERFDLAVIPSISESMGIVALEFMNCGIPIVASNVGGLRNLLTEDETVLFSEKADSDDLADKITTLLNDKAMRIRFVENGFHTIPKYLLPAYMDKLDNIYKELYNA